MNFSDWYTDLMTVKRASDNRTGSVVRTERVIVAEDIPCRVYQSSDPAPRMNRQAADITLNNKVACANGVDVIAGDELIIVRGAKLGYTTDVVQGFAGEPHPFYEPYGAVAPGLAHTEIPILQMRRI